MHKLLLLSIFLLAPSLWAQTEPEVKNQTLETLLNKALAISIEGRLLGVHGELWQTKLKKLTIPGRSVSFEMMGEAVKIKTTLTPHEPKTQYFILTVQSELWIKRDGVTSYKAIMQNIPIKIGEPIFYLPLGRSGKDTPPLEIQIELNPYKSNE